MGPKKKGLSKASSKKESSVAVPETITLPTISEQIKTNTLLQTVGSGDTKTVTRLVAHYDYGDTLLRPNLSGTTALMVCARHGDIDGTDNLLSMQNATSTNVDLREIQQIGGFSALHHACANGHEKVVELLLKFGANPDIQALSAIGETPLHICCKKGDEGNIRCAKILLSLGAKPNAVDKFGNTALFWANRSGNTFIQKELSLPNKVATADSMIALAMKRIPNFTIPSGKSGKKKTSSSGKGKKKK